MNTECRRSLRESTSKLCCISNESLTLLHVDELTCRMLHRGERDLRREEVCATVALRSLNLDFPGTGSSAKLRLDVMGSSFLPCTKLLLRLHTTTHSSLILRSSRLFTSSFLELHSSRPCLRDWTGGVRLSSTSSTTFKVRRAVRQISAVSLSVD